MKTTRKVRKLVCLRCDGESFSQARATVIQEFRDESLEVSTDVMRCSHCGWETLAPGQLDSLRMATADAYRRRHGLLCSSQIRDIRAKLGLSQRAFAKHIGVGPASIPRWETYGVQEPVYDKIIRRADKPSALLHAEPSNGFSFQARTHYVPKIPASIRKQSHVLAANYRFTMAGM